MRGLFKWMLLGTLLGTLLVSVTAQTDEQESHLSVLILRLLEKYDSEKKGSIPRESYPEFIVDVFVEGSPEAIFPETLDLLRQAAVEFSAKYDKATSVDTHEFFNDIIVNFTTFLMKHEDKYMDVLNDLYYDREDDKDYPEDSSREEDYLQLEEFSEEQHSYEL